MAGRSRARAQRRDAASASCAEFAGGLEQRHYDVIGLALVAAGAYLAFVLYLGWDGGRVGSWLGTGLEHAAGRVAYVVPVALAGWGAALIARPLLRHPHGAQRRRRAGARRPAARLRRRDRRPRSRSADRATSSSTRASWSRTEAPSARRCTGRRRRSSSDSAPTSSRLLMLISGHFAAHRDDGRRRCWARPGLRSAAPAPGPATSRGRSVARREPAEAGWGDAPDGEIAITRGEPTEPFATEPITSELDDEAETIAGGEPEQDWAEPEQERRATRRRATSAAASPRRAASSATTPMAPPARARTVSPPRTRSTTARRRRRRSSAASPTRARTPATGRRRRRHCSSRCATSGSRRGCWARSAGRT